MEIYTVRTMSSKHFPFNSPERGKIKLHIPDLQIQITHSFINYTTPLPGILTTIEKIIPLPQCRSPELSACHVAPALACRSSSHCRSCSCLPTSRTHRYLPAKRWGYSSSPSAPRAAKGPHTTRKS
jgi:hypothetical protein